MLVVMRDIGFVGVGCDVFIFINGEIVVKLVIGEKVIFYLNVGELIVGVFFEGVGLCVLNFVC